MSRNTFARVLNFLGIKLSENEFDLLIDKYRYDAFTMKYNAFLRELEEVRHWLEKYDYVDVSGVSTCSNFCKTMSQQEIVTLETLALYLYVTSFFFRFSRR